MNRLELEVLKYTGIQAISKTIAYSPFVVGFVGGFMRGSGAYLPMNGIECILGPTLGGGAIGLAGSFPALRGSEIAQNFLYDQRLVKIDLFGVEKEKIIDKIIYPVGELLLVGTSYGVSSILGFTLGGAIGRFVS